MASPNALAPLLHELFSGVKDTASGVSDFGSGLLQQLQDGIAAQPRLLGGTPSPSVTPPPSIIPDGQFFSDVAGSLSPQNPAIGEAVGGAVDSVGNFISNLDEPYTNTIKQGIAALTPDSKEPTQEVAADVKELPGTIAAIEQADATPKQKTDAKAKVTSETSVAMVDEAKADMAASGATPEQLSQFDKFAGEYDIATIGMALLASNDGTGTFSANLGKAMLLGKQAKTKQQERADAKADKVTKAEAASR